MSCITCEAVYGQCSGVGAALHSHSMCFVQDAYRDTSLSDKAYSHDRLEGAFESD